VKYLQHFILAAAICTFPAISQATVVVPGTSDPWLAGMPDGSNASSGDSAPAQSPVLFDEFALTPGSWLRFTVTVDPTAGLVGHCPGCTSPTPDGGSVWGHSAGAENGVADVDAPINSLLGVFLDASQPNTTAAPTSLNFDTMNTSFATLSPTLKQVFFIGDGLTGTGSGDVQTFLVPAGATRLYLGTMDGYGWYNNVGAYAVTVTAVPEPEIYASLLVGLGLIGTIARRGKLKREEEKLPAAVSGAMSSRRFS
jgi:hypothetical protein